MEIIEVPHEIPATAYAVWEFARDWILLADWSRWQIL